VAQQFVRADELESGGIRSSGSGDIERQTVSPDRNSVIQRSGGGRLTKESPWISQVPDTTLFGEILSSPMAKVVVAGTTLLTAVVVWHHYTRS
jgi:hypothetical protein